MDRLTRQYVKLCDLADFDDPELLATIGDLLPERDPAAHVERKVWEFAMCALFLRDTDRLHDDSELLAVGAGDERLVFWLANQVGRVVATDIYGSGRFATREGAAAMLEDPAERAPFPYREDRLEVLWMDGRELAFPDASFDVVVSISSVEHFGGRRGMARAARELGRVLRPGGHAFVVTECFLSTRARRLLRGADVFTWREIETFLIGPSGLRLMQPVDRHVSQRSWENLTAQTLFRGLRPRTGTYFPHVLLSARGAAFTSVALALQKPAG